MEINLRACTTLAAACAAVAFTGSALALHKSDHKSGEAWKARLLAESPNSTGATNSDLAFWGNKAFAGNYNGFRIFDISDPANPSLITDFACPGAQNDLTVWDRDGNGEADLLIASVDRTMTGSACGSAPSAAHDDPNGWEGLRVFDISNPYAPVQIGAVYQHCGSHTHTLLPDPGKPNQLMVLNSSYPLRPGPTCGPVRGPENGRDPLHGVIQVVKIEWDSMDPLNNSKLQAAAHKELPISYPGDPDGKFRPARQGLNGPFHDLTACHDIAVFQPLGLVAGACARQAQMWRIDSETGLPDTENPLWVYDDRDDTDGPGGGDVAVDFWHSATFSPDGKTVVFIDESFGDGCPATTFIKENETSPAKESDTGRMYFLNVATGQKLSHYQLQRQTPESDPADYCSSHLGNTVHINGRNLLVNAWYTGGVDVIDFTNPRKPREIAFWDKLGDHWSAYWYEFGIGNATGPMTIYGTHGVVHNGTAGQPRNGLQVFEVDVGGKRQRLQRLNPQTHEVLMK